MLFSKMAVVGCFVSVAACLDEHGRVPEEVPSRQDSSDGDGEVSPNNEGEGEGEGDGVALRPCIDVEPNDIDFGRVMIRSEASADLAIINCGTSSVIVQEVNLMNDSDGQFSLRFADNQRGGRNLTIPSGEQLLLFIFFTPHNGGRSGGSISIVTKDPDQRFSVQLIGEGIPANTPQRPVAIALAGVAGVLDPGNYQPHEEPSRALRVEPGAIIELRGSGSLDFNAGGRIVRYEWKTIGQPDNADLPRDGRGRLSELADTTVRLPLPGQYIFQLTVENQFGLSATGLVYVVAEFANSTTIELTWGGDEMDLDLHFRHEGGEWFQEPWDCHFANQNPEWGAAGEQNDPHLDRDCNGLQCGSETIVIGELEPNVEYEIGVHLRFVNGNRTTTMATIRVIRSGMLQHEATHRLEADSWWSVARLRAQVVTPVNELLRQPPRE